MSLFWLTYAAFSVRFWGAAADKGAPCSSQLCVADISLSTLQRAFANNKGVPTSIEALLPDGEHVTLTPRSFDTYTVSNAANCLRSSSNTCCAYETASSGLPPSVYLEDAAGLPLCGQFVFQDLDPGAGLGHWLSEYMSLVNDTETLPSVQRVTTSTAMGHHISRAQVEQVLGLELGVRYNETAVHEAVAHGYLRQVNGISKQPLGVVFDPTNAAVLYTYERAARNAAKDLPRLRRFFQERLTAQRLRHPVAHATLFRRDAVAVCVHVRRGDVDKASVDRFLPLSYYVTVLAQIKRVQADLDIVVISEGRVDNFKELTAAHPEVILLLADDPMRAFVHMLYADVLVTSRSGFSHLAAELGYQSCIVAVRSWVTYSRSNITLFADETYGTLNMGQLKALLS